MSITIAPEVYDAMRSVIQDGKHISENELIDAAMREYLKVPVPTLPEPESTECSEEENKT